MPTNNPPMKSLPSGIITAMFTDIVDSTRIKSQMEGETSARRDANYRQQIKEPHDAVVLSCVRQAGGYVVNPTGDGFCITFVDAEEAVLCALRIQHHFENHPIATPLGELQIRIGLHTGIAGASGDDYIASTVDKTARVQSQAIGGQVYVSHQTQVLVSDITQGVVFEPRGIFHLKGLQAEELYQAIPSPDLQLLPADQEIALAEESGIKQRPLKTSRRRLIAGVLFIAMIGVCGAGVLMMKSGQPETVFPAGSQWRGGFKFLPPITAYEGTVAVDVMKSDGETFEGIYSSEEGAYQWQIEGTIKGKEVHWEFVKPIKNPGSEDATGKAYCDVTIEGDQMKGYFRTKADSTQIAELDLRALKH